MKNFTEMNKKELHRELRWYKKKFQYIAKEEMWADWIVFYSYSDPSYQIISELKKRGLKNYDQDLIWWWQAARDKAENLLNIKLKWGA